MNKQDEEALNKWLNENPEFVYSVHNFCTETSEIVAETIWKAALEHARSGEAVAYETLPDEIDGSKFERRKLFTHSQPASEAAATVIGALLSSLENLALACGRNSGWEDHPHEMNEAKSSIAAAKKLIKGDV